MMIASNPLPMKKLTTLLMFPYLVTLAIGPEQRLIIVVLFSATAVSGCAAAIDYAALFVRALAERRGERDSGSRSNL